MYISYFHFLGKERVERQYGSVVVSKHRVCKLICVGIPQEESRLSEKKGVLRHDELSGIVVDTLLHQCTACFEVLSKIFFGIQGSRIISFFVLNNVPCPILYFGGQSTI